MTDTINLVDNRFLLIEWNPASPKWQDVGNDFFCSDRRGDGWLVSARRGFEDGNADLRFTAKHEALQFFVNYLFGRRMRLASGEKAVGPDLIDRRYEVVQWDAASSKWIDSGNNFFCSQRIDGQGWRVSARYDFPDGRDTIEFDSEHDAFEFFVNFLFTRMMRLMEERRAA